jgi:hypothetical protein
MSASVSSSKTVTTAVAPHLPASTLTTLMATPIESLTVAQLNQIHDSLRRVSGGAEPTALIGSLLK